jgi:hypothetical protein
MYIEHNSAFRLCYAVGYELIYDYLRHVLGVQGQYSGVGIHIGHFVSHFRMSSGSTVTNFQMRRLIHTGVALWLRGFASKVLRPCCEVSLVGGDGTFIGIPTQNIPACATPAWQPHRLCSPSVSWDRRSRQPLAKAFEDSGLDKKAIDELLEQLKNSVSTTNSESTRLSVAEAITHSDVLRRTVPELVVELTRWLRLTCLSREYQPLRAIFSCLFANDSLTGLFPPQLASTLLENIPKLAIQQSCLKIVEEFKTEYAFRGCGLGPEIAELFSVQISTNHRVHQSSLNMIQYFVKIAANMYRQISRKPESQHQQDNSDLEWRKRHKLFPKILFSAPASIFFPQYKFDGTAELIPAAVTSHSQIAHHQGQNIR